MVGKHHFLLSGQLIDPIDLLNSLNLPLNLIALLDRRKHDARGHRAQYLIELVVLAKNGQLLPNGSFQRLWQVVAEVDEDYDADYEVRDHYLRAKLEIEMNVQLDHASAERDEET